MSGSLKRKGISQMVSLFFLPSEYHFFFSSYQDKTNWMYIRSVGLYKKFNLGSAQSFLMQDKILIFSVVEFSIVGELDAYIYWTVLHIGLKSIVSRVGH